MNIVKRLIATQPWIEDVTRNGLARAALIVMAQKTIKPRHRKLLQREAHKYNVIYTDLLAFNLSYEVAILALTVDKIPTMPDVAKLIARAGRKAQPVGCTTVGVVRDNKVEFWRNLDWDDPGRLLADNSTLETTDKWVSATFPGAVGMLTAYRKGTFDSGYAIAINAICKDDDELVLGTPPTFLVREVVEECATFDEAVEVLCERELLCAVMFTVVSAAGSMVVIERGSKTYKKRYPQDTSRGGFAIVATNSTSDGGSSALGDLSETSDTRYQNVWDGLNSPTQMENIMADAEFGCTVHTVAVTFDEEEPMELFF